MFVLLVATVCFRLGEGINCHTRNVSIDQDNKEVRLAQVCKRSGTGWNRTSPLCRTRLNRTVKRNVTKCASIPSFTTATRPHRLVIIDRRLRYLQYPFRPQIRCGMRASAQSNGRLHTLPSGIDIWWLPYPPFRCGTKNHSGRSDNETTAVLYEFNCCCREEWVEKSGSSKNFLKKYRVISQWLFDSRLFHYSWDSKEWNGSSILLQSLLHSTARSPFKCKFIHWKFSVWNPSGSVNFSEANRTSDRSLRRLHCIRHRNSGL